MALEQIIKYEGDNTTFVWKHPCEDFNTGSQLIVHESQEAIFFMNGQALDLFGPGKYALETQNIPVIRKVMNLPTGGISPFHCEVYFVNKTEQLAIRWGTDTRVQYIDPTYGFPLSIGCNGEMSLTVDDARKLLVKIVGTACVLTQSGLVSLFKSFLMTRVKTYIAQVMKEDMISIFEIDSKLEVFSAALRNRLIPDFEEYGMALRKFFVTAVSKPDGDVQYEKFKELFFRQYADIAEARLQQQVGVIEEETVAKRRIIEAQGLAEKRKTEGYTYQQERGFDIAEKAATNEGAGNFGSAGIGLGMMAGIGGVVGNSVGGIFSDTMDSVRPSRQQNMYCDNCGTILEPGSEFCDNCGTRVDTGNKCTKCGFVFIRPGKFCPKCGSHRG